MESSVVFTLSVSELGVGDSSTPRSRRRFSERPLLDTILERNVRLIDYECITDTGNRGDPRTIAFGEFAGMAGMIDSLRGVGEKMLASG